MSWNRVTYRDETHNADSYWICGVVLDIDDVRATQNALVDVAKEAAADYGLASTPELHGNDLFHGEQDFDGVAASSARLGVCQGSRRAAGG